MSKPQVASEPTLEEILTSIRKMISDDKPGPAPMPDQMGRTPFGEHVRNSAGSAASDAAARPGNEPGGGPLNGAAPAPTFNSLSDALKVATALSDQRRSLQQDIANVIEKGPRSNLDALAEVSAARADMARTLGDGRPNASPDADGPVLPGPSESRIEPAAAPAGEGKRDLLSFDFGTMVPQRDDQSKPSAAAKPAIATPAAVTPAAASPAPEAPLTKPESKAETTAEPRVLHLRSGLNGSAAHGLNGAAPNVAPFPRPVREAAKPADAGPAAPAEKAPEAPGKREATIAEPTPATSKQVTAEEAVPAKGDTKSAQADAMTARNEALLDAVVDLVQQQPDALSVFASGASFISGVVAKHAAGEPSPAVEVKSEAPDVTGVPPAKLDGAAAELLRPMLRQWLAENMERILEEALRSEVSGGKGSGKT